MDNRELAMDNGQWTIIIHRLSSIVHRPSSIAFLFSLFIVHYAFADTASQMIRTKKVGVSVSPVRMYADSVYTKSTENTFQEGELFEIIGETVREHYDNTQNQTFKWYKIRTGAGKIGWVFGDNLAVVMQEAVVDIPLRKFHKQPAHFDNGFENSIIWIAATNGHDDKFKDKSFLNPPYREYYFVITNERGKSVFINYANVSESGTKDIRSLRLADVNDNKIDEIILETTNNVAGKNKNERNLEIYGFKSGTLAKIFEERLTLDWETDVPSPALAKFVEIENNTIRVAYIDYVPCEKFSLDNKTDNRSRTGERCMEYVTYSLGWDKNTRSFKPLYKESRTFATACVTQNLNLRLAPAFDAPFIRPISTSDRLQIIKHSENIINDNGQKRVVNRLYVRIAGVYGYVPADKIMFKYIEHAALLSNYYKQTPLMKQDWTFDTDFVSIKTP